jgi:hypothetical protein
MNEHMRSFRDLAAHELDTRTLLRNAAEQGVQRHYEDFFIADVDSHHYETEAIKEIAQYIENPVLRHETLFQGMSRGGITSESGSYQEIAGRITRYPLRKSEKVPTTPHRDITLMERWMDALGVDVAIMFPTPMLNLANCPASRSRLGSRAPTTPGSATTSSIRIRASSRCSICRSTILMRPARWWRTSATAMGSSASW